MAAIVGEFRWNFPWPICAFFYLLYGAVLRLTYQRLIVDKGDFASVAIYAVLGLYLVEMTFGSPSQNNFEMLDVLVPMMLIRGRFSSFCRRGSATLSWPRPRFELFASVSPRRG